MTERIAERLKRREETIQAHMSAVEQHIDNLVADAPEELSEDRSNSIRVEFLDYARRVLDALSSEELANLSCLEGFIVSLKAHARMKFHQP